LILECGKQEFGAKILPTSIVNHKNVNLLYIGTHGFSQKIRSLSRCILFVEQFADSATRKTIAEVTRNKTKEQ
jgi:hypothetical protein